MTPICRQQITEKTAWRGSDFRSKDDAAFELSSRNVAALEDLLLRLKSAPLDSIERKDTGHPGLDADLAKVYDEVINGRGLVCINFGYSSIIPALQEIGRELTAEETEAIDLLRDVLLRQQLDVRLDAGEASVINNFVMCHSRSNFVDGERPEDRRLVLRAWTEVPPADRRLPLGREFFWMENENGGLGYDKVAGREAKIARNDYVAVDDKLADLFKATQQKPKPRAAESR